MPGADRARNSLHDPKNVTGGCGRRHAAVDSAQADPAQLAPSGQGTRRQGGRDLPESWLLCLLAARSVCQVNCSGWHPCRARASRRPGQRNRVQKGQERVAQALTPEEPAHDQAVGEALGPCGAFCLNPSIFRAGSLHLPEALQILGQPHNGHPDPLAHFWFLGAVWLPLHFRALYVSPVVPTAHHMSVTPRLAVLG